MSHQANVPAPPWQPWVGSHWVRFAADPQRQIVRYWLTLLEPMEKNSLEWRVIIMKPGDERLYYQEGYRFPIPNVSYMRLD